MIPPNFECARALRDGGIDAIAALNAALIDALPTIDLERHKELKRFFGESMGMISDNFINPSIKAFPELEPDQETWVLIARSRAVARLESA